MSGDCRRHAKMPPGGETAREKAGQLNYNFSGMNIKKEKRAKFE